MHFAPFQDRSRGSQIIDTSVGTGTDHRLIHSHLFCDLADRLRILRKMRERDGRFKSAKIDGILSVIYGVLIRFIHFIGTSGVFFHISLGQLVHREDPVLSACFNGHIGNGEAVVHGEIFDSLSHKFH